MLELEVSFSGRSFSAAELELTHLSRGARALGCWGDH
jgi:hypothetical protein